MDSLSGCFTSSVKKVGVEPKFFDMPSGLDLRFQYLNELRKEKLFCDVLLRVGKKTEIQAHRVVLAQSPYLKKVLMSAPKRKTLELEDVDPESITVLVEYMYTGKLRITEVKATFLYAASNLLELHEVSIQCIALMQSSITVGNCWRIRDFAETHKLPTLLIATDDFITLNFTDVVNDSTFMELDSYDIFAMIRLITRLDNNRGPNSRFVYEAMMRWSNWDKQRQKYVPKILKLIDAFNETRVDPDHIDFLDKPTPEKPEGPETISVLTTCDRSCNSKNVITGESSASIVSIRKPPRRREFQQGSSVLERDEIDSTTAHSGRTPSMIKKPAKRRSDPKLLGVGGQSVKRNRATPNSSMSAVPLPNLQIVFPNIPSTRKKTVQMGIKSYNFKTKCMKHLYLANRPRELSSFVYVRDKVYDIGGCLIKRGAPVSLSAPINDSAPSCKVVEIFSMERNKVEKAPPLIHQVKEAAACVFFDSIYVIGGSDGLDTTNVVQTLDLSLAGDKAKWAERDFLNSPRAAHDVAAVGNSIFAVGGVGVENPAIGGAVELRTAEIYDAANDVWKFVAPMETPRGNVKLCTWDDRIYAIGGMSRDSRSLNTVEIYNTELDAWSFTASMNCCRRDCGAFAYQGLIYAIGGNSSLNPSVEVYDPRLDRWMIFESWPENLPKEYRFRSTILTSPQPPQPEESTKDSSTEDESESDFENASSEER